jgi:hypothetical protein
MTDVGHVGYIAQPLDHRIVVDLDEDLVSIDARKVITVGRL